MIVGYVSLKCKIGPHEFEAEGPQLAVELRWYDFRHMVNAYNSPEAGVIESALGRIESNLVLICEHYRIEPAAAAISKPSEAQGEQVPLSRTDPIDSQGEKTED